MDLQTVYKYADEWINHCAENDGHSSIMFISDNIDNCISIESAVIQLLEEHNLIKFLSSNRRNSIVVLTINGHEAHKTKGGVKEYIKSKKLEIKTTTAIDKISNGFWESIGAKLGEHSVTIVLLVLAVILGCLLKTCNSN